MDAFPAPVGVAVRASQPRRRQLLIDVLERLGGPASLRCLSELAGVWCGVSITASAIRSLLRAEARLYRQDPGGCADLLVPALDAATLNAITPLVTWSSWPAERRLIGTRSLRVLQLSTLFALLDRRYENECQERLDILTRSYAESVPGAIAPGQPLDRERVHAAADAELRELAGIDADDRRGASERLLQLPLAQQLWGMPVLLAGVLG